MSNQENIFESLRTRNIISAYFSLSHLSTQPRHGRSGKSFKSFSTRHGSFCFCFESFDWLRAVLSPPSSTHACSPQFEFLLSPLSVHRARRFAWETPKRFVNWKNGHFVVCGARNNHGQMFRVINGTSNAPSARLACVAEQPRGFFLNVISTLKVLVECLSGIRTTTGNDGFLLRGWSFSVCRVEKRARTRRTSRHILFSDDDFNL